MKGCRVYRCLLVFLMLWGLSNAAAAAATKTTVIKVALITPEGSAWTNSLYKLAAAVKEGRLTLSESESKQFVSNYGIPVASSRIATSPRAWLHKHNKTSNLWTG